MPSTPRATATSTLKRGDRVVIVGGMFTKHRFGTYLRPCGDKGKMACVRLDGDTQRERNLWLSSLLPLAPEATRSSSTPSPSNSNATNVVTMSRDDYNEMLQEIEALSDAVKRLKIKARNINN